MAVARELFGIDVAGEADITELPSERDQNFHLASGYVLKLSSASESRATLALQHEAIAHVVERDPTLPVPRVKPDLSGAEVVTTSEGYLCRVVDFLPGTPFASFRPQTPELLYRLGQTVGRLDIALEGFTHEAQSRELKWDMRRAPEVIQDGIALVEASQSKTVLERGLERASELLPRLEELPRGVIHNDANDHNLLIGRDGEVTGILDFGDMLEGAFVCDLAILVAYAMLGKTEPVSVAARIVAGYHAERPLDEKELSLVFPLAAARLAMSVSISARQFRDEPDKDYLRVSEAPAWRFLERLSAEPALERLAHYAFRAACGMEPHPGAADARRFFDASEPAPVLPVELTSVKRHVFDLSAGSLELSGLDVIEDVARFTRHLFGLMKAEGASVGIGRYDEARPIYTSEAFLPPTTGESVEPRTLHLGIDLFVEAGTPIHAPIDGVVHSFRFNDPPLDYGPTIILEHDQGYTLYGHLSLASLEGLEKGRRIGKGERFAEVGDYPTNGNWPPHLHFQIVLDLLDHEGDFPGVARASERDLWLGLSPDPSRLLGLPSERAKRLDLLPRRHDHLSKSMSLAYERPLQIVRGYGPYLYDDRARPYLDLVNNVCHVGHAHPRVVRAASAQAAVLNTNTRYLHPNILDYAERLVARLPDPLEVCFFVNSGSEANDLALRLARAHTGTRRTIVLDGAYHGNLTSLIEVSPYKFDGKGGAGAPEHVTKLPMPDGFRGIFRAAKHGWAERYLKDAVERIGTPKDPSGSVGTLLTESIMSCGGQIVLPSGYLKGLYAAVRERGGVVIADEVQVGFGRVGSHFWAFEAEGVVPDIVTMGKPIGNGHPLGCVVTTREIARSFENGMEYFNTFGGNPVSCAVGLAVLDVIEDEKLQANAAHAGNALLSGLRLLGEVAPLVGDVRGRGLFLGFELVRDRETLEPAAREARYVVNRMKDLGFLTSTDGPLENVIKLKPPLVFSEAQAGMFLDQLASVMKENPLTP